MGSNAREGAKAMSLYSWFLSIRVLEEEHSVRDGV